MSGTDYLVLLTVLAAVSAYLLYYCYRTYRRYRFVDGTATSKIRSAAQGYVELKGLGEWLPKDTIASPFSKSRCIWYHARSTSESEAASAQPGPTSSTSAASICSGWLMRRVPVS